MLLTLTGVSANSWALLVILNSEEDYPLKPQLANYVAGSLNSIGLFSGFGPEAAAMAAVGLA